MNQKDKDKIYKDMGWLNTYTDNGKKYRYDFVLTEKDIIDKIKKMAKKREWSDFNNFACTKFVNSHATHYIPWLLENPTRFFKLWLKWDKQR